MQLVRSGGYLEPISLLNYIAAPNVSSRHPRERGDRLLTARRLTARFSTVSSAAYPVVSEHVGSRLAWG